MDGIGPELCDDDTNILHVDMDAFFACVEVMRNPALRGKPVIVAGLGPRGVVAAASYEARAYGVRSALPTVIARRRCPQGIFLEPTGSYGDISQGIMAIFNEFSPLVQPLSVDEAFIDVRGSRRLFGPPRQIAAAIKRRIREQYNLAATVGIASTPFLAKLASTASKPDGLGVVAKATELTFLHGLPIKAMWGVGAKTAEKLEGLGLHTIGDIAALPIDRLRRIVGKASGEHLWALARNLDARAVVTTRVEKSISAEHTFDTDADGPKAWGPVVLTLAQKVTRRARANGFMAAGVSVKLRFGDFRTITRSRSLHAPTDTGHQVAEIARSLMEDEATEPIRLVGVRLDHLVSASMVGQQLALGEKEFGWREIEQAMDAVDKRWGRGFLGPASALKPPIKKEPPTT